MSNYFKIIIITLLVASTLSPAPVQAASQSITVNPFAASDDPLTRLNDNSVVPASSQGLQLLPPLNDASTDFSSYTGGAPDGFTFRVTIPPLCEGAMITGLRIRTDTTADNSGPGGGILLGAYRGSDLTVIEDYIINNGYGEDANTWLQALSGNPAPIISRGNELGSIIYPADLGIEGMLDGTWDISGAQPGDQIGILIEHLFFAAGTDTVQTIISAVDIIYDDAGCLASGGEASSEDETDLLAPNTGLESAHRLRPIALLIIGGGLLIIFLRLVRRDKLN